MKDVTGHKSGVMTGAISTLLIVLLPLFLLLSCTGVDTKNASNSSASAAVRVPSQPGNITARSSDGKVTLAWAPPALATSYNLYWSTTSGVTTASNRILNVSMPYTHLDLTNGTAYFYKVSALNVSGESELSAEVRATPMPPFSKILTKLTDPDAEPWEEFGWSVAIDGDYAVVGAWRSSNLDPLNPIPYVGAAYVFRKVNGVWDPAGTKLLAPDAQVNDHFGCSVSISGAYIIVGARDEDGGQDDPLENAGAAYIYHMTGDNAWDTGVKITGPDPHEWAKFGYSVSISGDYAVVGQKGENAAYVFRRTGENAWDMGTMLSVPGSDPLDDFGIAVGISGDYAIVGASGDDGEGNLMPEAGAAYIFHRTGLNAWEEVSKIMPYDGGIGNFFGYSVAISGDYAAVGAYRKSDDIGAVYVFHRLEQNFWDEGPKVVAPDAQTDDYFGASIGITDRYLIVGAAEEDCGWDNNMSEGAAYVFERIGSNTWDGGTKITVPQGDVADDFGHAVAISGEHAIIGAIGDDYGENERPSTGAVYLY